MLSEQQIASFRQNGFLHIPNAINPRELDGIRQWVDSVIADPQGQPEHIKQDLKYGAIIGEGVGQGEKLCRIEYTFHKDPRFLALLAHPQILNVASSLHPAPVVVTWEDMVIKTPHSGFAVAWHQDLLYQSTKEPVFSIGIYLDDSDDDPLQFIPGTQVLGPLSDAQRTALVQERKSEIVKRPAHAGDLLIHNVLMVHGSEPNDSSRYRRALYFEFRTVSQVRNDSPWDEAWLQKRLQLVPHAIKLRQASEFYKDDAPALWEDLLRRKNDWLPVPTDPEGELCLRVHHEDFPR